MRGYVKNLRSATIHVGVNVSNTRPLLMVQPVFEDDSFIFIPIPSRGEGTSYRQLCGSMPEVCEVLKELGFSLNIEVHNDPEFEEFTFGEGPRKWMLAQLRPGDYIFFVVSMKKICVPSKADFSKHPEKYKQELKSVLKKNRGPNWFFGLIGQFKISEIYAGKNLIKRYGLHNNVHELNATVKDKLKTNAHIKRGDHFTGDYIIIKGGDESQIYQQALQISQGNTCLAELTEIFHKYALKKNGTKWFEAIFGDHGTNLLLNFIKLRI
jgi:hypothetical protein